MENTSNIIYWLLALIAIGLTCIVFLYMYLKSKRKENNPLKKIKNLFLFILTLFFSNVADDAKKNIIFFLVDATTPLLN